MTMQVGAVPIVAVPQIAQVQVSLHQIPLQCLQLLSGMVEVRSVVYDAMCGMCKALSCDVLMELSMKNTVLWSVMVWIVVGFYHLRGVLLPLVTMVDEYWRYQDLVKY